MSETIEKNLNVLYWKSKQSFYCSEASAQMFLDYYGYKLNQDYIHQYADRFENLLPFLNKYVRTIELIPNKSLIIDSINNKNPVILRIHNKYLHTIVVTGYTDNDFIIHDPDQRANIYIDQDKLMDISEKIILKREKMSEVEELEKKLQDLKRQREEIKSPEIDKDEVLSRIMELDYEACGVISNILRKNGNPDPDAETNKLMDKYRGIEKKLVGQLGLKEKLQEMIHG